MHKSVKIVAIGLATITVACSLAIYTGTKPSVGACMGGDVQAMTTATTAFSNFRTAAADGNCLQVYEWKPVNGQVLGTAVLVHGIYDHARRYDALARALNAQGIAVYAHDHRGHGGSGGARQRVDSVAQLAGDVDVIVRDAMKRHAGRPVFLYGHSMGGLVATHYAANQGTQPDTRLAGVVISSAALKLPPDVNSAKLFVVNTLSKIAPEMGLDPVDGHAVVRDPAAQQALLDDPLILKDKVPARTVATILGGIGTIRPQFEAVSIPALILHGTGDRVTVVEGSRELSERASTKDKTLVLHEGLFHDLLHEPEGPEIIKEITTFMTKHLGGGA